MRIFHNEECVCFTSIPLSCLRIGYRSMTLFEENEDNNYQIEVLPLSKLFLRIGILQNEPAIPGNIGGGESLSTPIKSQYSKEFSPSMTASTSLPRSRDTDARMVGMDVSPGNKHWRRLQKSKSDASESVSIQETSPPKQRHHIRRSASTGDAVPQLSSSSSKPSHRERDRDSRDRRRSRRERTNRSPSGATAER